MQFSRGCRFSCDFCAISVFFNRRNYVRRTREVLDEITSQPRKFVFFVDDNLLSDFEAAKQFLRELIPLRIRWVSQASLDMTSDLELMDLLVRAKGSRCEKTDRSMSSRSLVMSNEAWDTQRMRSGISSRKSSPSIGQQIVVDEKARKAAGS